MTDTDDIRRSNAEIEAEVASRRRQANHAREVRLAEQQARRARHRLDGEARRLMRQRQWEEARGRRAASFDERRKARELAREIRRHPVGRGEFEEAVSSLKEYIADLARIVKMMHGAKGEAGVPQPKANRTGLDLRRILAALEGANAEIDRLRALQR
jgi:hypothetical protein